MLRQHGDEPLKALEQDRIEDARARLFRDDERPALDVGLSRPPHRDLLHAREARHARERDAQVALLDVAELGVGVRAVDEPVQALDERRRPPEAQYVNVVAGLVGRAGTMDGERLEARRERARDRRALPRAHARAEPRLLVALGPTPRRIEPREGLVDGREHAALARVAPALVPARCTPLAQWGSRVAAASASMGSK